MIDKTAVEEFPDVDIQANIQRLIDKHGQERVVAGLRVHLSSIREAADVNKNLRNVTKKIEETGDRIKLGGVYSHE